MKKNILLTLIALMCAIYAQAYDFKSGDLYYNITSYAEPYTVEVTYQKWLSSDNYKHTSVIIPATVTYNGKTYSVTSIGNEAFWGCTRLTSVTIGNSVTSIGENAFSGCTGLTSVTIGNSVTSIGSNAFRGCTGLTSITIPNSVTSIGKYAFKGCKGLTSVTIGNSVTSIGDSAFYECRNLTSVAIPNSVTSIGSDAFGYCTGLKSVTIGNSVTSIGELAFRVCTGLTSITIPNSVTSIGDEAFRYCTGLTSVVWNAKKCGGWTEYKKSPFYSVNGSIKSFTFGEEVDSIPQYLCYEMNKLTSITIPNSVTSIGKYAFKGCKGLTSVTIGNSVTSIGNYAFQYCTRLTSVTIPNSVTSIGWSAFSGCTGLTSITIPNSVTSIGGSAFYGCTGLTSITIPNSVTSIGSGAFSGCTGLTSIVVESANTVYDSRNNCNAIIETATNALIQGCNTTIIPENITSIESYAFEGCTGLTSVTIGNSVTSIGYCAFEGCTGLTSITIPNSVTSIGWSAFSGCTGLTSVTIPNSVTSIGQAAFADCTGLTSITIPNSVTTSIGNSAFWGCTGLTSATIGNNVPSIGYKAFYGCTGLTSVTIGNSVTSIESCAFSGCTGLTAISVSAGSPPGIQSDTFEDVPTNISIYVPCNAVKAYQTATYWSKFTNYIERFYPITVTTQDNAKGSVRVIKEATSCTDNTAIFEATANEHYYFCCWNDGNTDNPRTVSVEGGVTYTAMFWEDIYTISATATNGRVEGAGYLVEVEGTGYYSYGTTATLTAVADEHYHFSQWSDGNTDNPRIVSVTGNAAYTAEFAIDQHNIGATAQNGRVEGASTYDYGTTATLTAIADEHYHFEHWSDGNTTNPRKVTVEGDATYTAVFAPNKYAISTSAENGYVEGAGKYDYGTTATLTAKADEHYHFVQWSDGNTDNPRTVSVEGDATYTAEFAIDQHIITATCDPQQGAVTGAGTYDYGTRVTLTATANDGYEFTRWSNGVTDNPYILIATEDLTLEAQFISTTAIDNISADMDTTTPQKVLINGQVYILRNGKTYTTTGVEVK